MKRLLIAALAAMFYLFPPTAFAQNAPSAAAVKSWQSTVSGSAGSATTLSGFPVAANDAQTVLWSYSSVGSGNTVTSEVSMDNGATWIAFPSSRPTSIASGQATGWAPSTSEVYQMDLSAGGMFRLRVSTYGSGTVTANATFRPFNTVSYATITGTSQVVGNAAAAAADSGNPVKIGCIYQTTPATVTDGQRSNVQCGQRGNVSATLWNSAGNAAAQTSGTLADGTANALGTLNTTGQNMLFNGSTWDREYTCPSSAVVNVALGTTSQLVALASSQIIRVCSFVISGDTLATTATFVYGTGANCGTGTTSLTGAMRMPDEGSIAISGANGSLFRTIASNALCLTAATGAVTGFVTYAQY